MLVYGGLEEPIANWAKQAPEHPQRGAGSRRMTEKGIAGDALSARS